MTPPPRSSQDLLSFAKTPSGGQVVDRSALIMPRSNRSGRKSPCLQDVRSRRQFHGLPSDPLGYTLTCPPTLRKRPDRTRAPDRRFVPIGQPVTCQPALRPVPSTVPAVNEPRPIGVSGQAGALAATRAEGLGPAESRVLRSRSQPPRPVHAHSPHRVLKERKDSSLMRFLTGTGHRPLPDRV
jgi:hypothetical protein